MRDKYLFRILLGLNAALAVAFVAYLWVSNRGDPSVQSVSFLNPSADTADGTLKDQLRKAADASSGSALNVAQSMDPSSADRPRPQASSSTNAVPNPEPVYTDRRFGWRDVETGAYADYVKSLRAVGCPEDKVRYIILEDIEELFAQKRLHESKQHDQPWWEAKPELTMAQLLREKGMELESQRIEMIRQWLGDEVAEAEQGEPAYWNHVQLTGPVLGALDTEKHQTVQEICAESIDRYQSIFWSGVNAGRPVNKLDLAQLRERTRSELVKELNEKQVEEFLLRYSHNAESLRQELRGFNPTPEEFRAIFSATDQLDHNMQLEYGGLEFLSAQQKERHERLRTQAIREALSQERFEDYLMTKDPLYQQAQSMALRYRAPSSAVLEIYEMTKETEARKQEILSDKALTPQQRNMALQRFYTEQQQKARDIAQRSNAPGQ
jgi:hypothetical protein